MGDYRLIPAVASDVDVLMRWFPTADATAQWGGPRFRFPFTRQSFLEDCHWASMASYVQREGDELLAFGQFYERYGRINLARLAVDPGRRGEGHGGRLVRALLDESKRHLDNSEYSLFVYRDNEPALRCYRAAGFRVSRYPEGAPLADECYYLTRPVERRD
jgi:ribosomal protein S18 acetylase RimI-like enzyme